LWAAEAFSAAYQVEARTLAEAYNIRSFRSSDPRNPEAPHILLPRRRLVQSLGLDIYEILPGQDFGFESSLRLYSDFGVTANERAKIDGDHARGVDLLFASINYRRKGWEARLGRQSYVDIVDYMAFDGLRLKYISPYRIGAEVFGGLWIKGSEWLGSSVYELEGTRESNLSSAGLSSLEPVFGLKLLAEDIGGFSGALGYRKALAAGNTNLERGTLEVRYGKLGGLSALAGADMDLMMSTLAQLRGQLRYQTDRWTATLDALRFTPVFSSDSIWYYFAFSPRDEARIRGDYTPAGPLRYYLALSAAWYHLNLNEEWGIESGRDESLLPGSLSPGVNLGTSFAVKQFRGALDLMTRGGSQGRQVWVDLTGGYAPSGRKYSLDGRISFARVNDGFNPELRGSFWGFQLWGSYALSAAARLSLVVEQNFNPVIDSDFKFFGMFDLRAGS
jgi:hypothetical protein